MGAVDPGEEAYRAGLEQARNTETQAPPRTVWPLICHQHAQLTRHRDDLLQASSRADIRAAEQDTVTARTTRQEIRAEQTAREEHLATCVAHLRGPPAWPTCVAHLRHRSQALQAVGRNDLVCQGLSHVVIKRMLHVGGSPPTLVRPSRARGSGPCRP
ncbi:hypothetical protein [Nonomuraea sp. NPDC049504]|uniref:hypothetical protein n=1 Tax=Nonomuraea sp. NPDC049504 TaxID=3154729 RepID=UPI003443D2EF